MSLLVYQSLWAMEDLPRDAPVQWTLAERVAQIAGAGFHGLSVDLGARQVPAAADLAAELRGSGLQSAVNAFVRDDESMDEALRYAVAIGAPLIIVCAQVYSLDLGAWPTPCTPGRPGRPWRAWRSSWKPTAAR